MCILLASECYPTFTSGQQNRITSCALALCLPHSLGPAHRPSPAPLDLEAAVISPFITVSSAPTITISRQLLQSYGAPLYAPRRLRTIARRLRKPSQLRPLRLFHCRIIHNGHERSPGGLRATRCAGCRHDHEERGAGGQEARP